jgi:hypothetical protein
MDGLVSSTQIPCYSCFLIQRSGNLFEKVGELPKGWILNEHKSRNNPKFYGSLRGAASELVISSSDSLFFLFLSGRGSGVAFGKGWMQCCCEKALASLYNRTKEL